MVVDRDVQVLAAIAAWSLIYSSSTVVLKGRVDSDLLSPWRAILVVLLMVGAVPYLAGRTLEFAIGWGEWRRFLNFFAFFSLAPWLLTWTAAWALGASYWYTVLGATLPPAAVAAYHYQKVRVKPIRPASVVPWSPPPRPSTVGGRASLAPSSPAPRAQSHPSPVSPPPLPRSSVASTPSGGARSSTTMVWDSQVYGSTSPQSGVACPRCGHVNNPGARFCARCGHRLI